MTQFFWPVDGHYSSSVILSSALSLMLEPLAFHTAARLDLQLPRSPMRSRRLYWAIGAYGAGSNMLLCDRIGRYSSHRHRPILMPMLPAPRSGASSCQYLHSLRLNKVRPPRKDR